MWYRYRRESRLYQREIGLDLSFSVADGQLEPTSLCLTDNRHALTGTYSLNGQVTGQGASEKLLQSLRGKFEFNAAGRPISTVSERGHRPGDNFDYLNEKGDFNIAFPDLDKESFPFRSSDSKERCKV